MQINDRFGAAAAFETVSLPDGTEAAVPTEHAAALYVNEQPAFRVVCTPELLPQLALGRLLTEGWIASAGEVEQIAVCAEGLKISVHLTHPLTARSAAAQEVSSCCTDNITLGSPVELQPLRGAPQLNLPPEWVDALAAAMSAGPQLLRAAPGSHPLRLRGHRAAQCAGQGRGQRNAGRRPAARMRPLHQRPRAGGHGAQSHPGRRPGTGEQDHAHRAVAGAGAGIWLTAALRPETSANIVEKCGVTSVRVDLLFVHVIIY